MVSIKEISDDKIKEIAENILKNKGEENTKIGNLYFDNYSYFDYTYLIFLLIDYMYYSFLYTSPIIFKLFFAIFAIS